MTTKVTRQLASAALAACMGAGCGLSEQDRPPAAGPSEFGQSISVAASPDRISQDGVSQSTVQVTVRDSQGKATPGVTVQWNVTAGPDTIYSGSPMLDARCGPPPSQLPLGRFDRPPPL